MESADPKNGFSNCLKYVTLEPTLFFYFLSLSISNFVGTNLLLRKSCDPFGDTGIDLKEPCLMESFAQHKVSSINSWKVPLTIVLSTVVVVLSGAWSDNTGKRRPLLFLPVIGHILTDLACCLNVYFWRWAPEIAALCESVIPGVTGHRNCFWIGAMCYMADVTTEKNRTLRIGIASAFYYICAPVGAGIAGPMNLKFGFMGTFLISAVFNLLGLLLGMIFIKDTTKCQRRNSEHRTAGSLFNSYKIFTKERQNFKRLKINALSLIPPLVIARMIGENTVMYLFVRRKFSWNEVDYSIFTAYKMITVLMGTLFSVGLLSHCCKVDDALVGIIGTAVDTVAAILYLLVATPRQLYLVPLVDLFSGAALTLATSISTKCVESNELAKMNTAQAVLSALFPIVISPLYTQVYSATLEYMPSFFFVVSIIISVPTVILFGIVYQFRDKVKEDTTSNVIAEKFDF